MATFNEANASIANAEASLKNYGNLINVVLMYNSELDGYYLYAQFEKGSMKEPLVDPISVNGVRVFFKEVSPKEPLVLKPVFVEPVVKNENIFDDGHKTVN